MPRHKARWGYAEGPGALVASLVAPFARTLLIVAGTQLVEEVRRRLATAADPAKAPAMQAYMKSSMPFRGVSSVPLKALLRGTLAEFPLDSVEAWRSAVLDLWDHAAYREERYAALALTGHRRYRAFQTLDQLDLYRHLVVTGAWWDYVDEVAKHRVGPILRDDFDEVSEIVRAWAVDDDLWVRRTAILSQLGSKAETDLPLLRWALVRNLEGSLHGSDFFIRKAVGWALREHAKTDPDWVRAFVAEHAHELSGLSRREALKHLG